MRGKTLDDTFRILARPKLDEMVDIYKEEKRKIRGASCSLDNITICKKYGWRWEEFLRDVKNAGLSLY